MVGLGRFELPTRGLGNRCSIHLSYRPTAFADRCIDSTPVVLLCDSGVLNRGNCVSGVIVAGSPGYLVSAPLQPLTLHFSPVATLVQMSPHSQ